MEDSFELQLLGEPCLRKQGNEVKIKRRKSLALLAFLAVEGGLHTRDGVASLLWPDVPSERSRASLRNLLPTVNKLFGARIILATRQHLQLNPEMKLQLDVETFQGLLTAVQTHHPQRSDTICFDCRQKLTTALAIGQRPFMAGFQLSGCAEFEMWMTQKAAACRDIKIGCLSYLLYDALAQGQPAAAQGYVQAWLATDPYAEEAHRLLMQLWERQGQRTAALLHYQQYARQLRDKLAIEPEPETVRLYQTMTAPPQPELAAAKTTADVSTIPFHNLPQPLTSFIGREIELKEIDERLARPACRLLTILGPGGMGKTQLALQYGRMQKKTYAHGIHFVPLVSISDAEFMVTAIADGVGFSFYSQEGLAEQLQNYLKHKEMLLILDNFEHLMAGRQLLLSILQAAPLVKLVVTSRESLNLKSEWLYDIEGLPYPAQAESADMLTFGAIQLFVEQTQRVQPHFVLSPENSDSIIRICQLLAGMPLGVELAAAMMRHFSAEEIISGLENHLDFLATAMHDVPERHRSLRAVFNLSWQQLTPLQQDVLRQLSLFKGGFSPEMAMMVAGTTLEMIAQLDDKSFLHQLSFNRYEIHAVLRQYAADSLAGQPPLQHAAQERFCACFADFLGRQRPRLRGRAQNEVWQHINQELENVRLAWQLSIALGRYEDLAQSLVTLFQFYDSRSLVKEGAAVFATAVVQLAQADKSPSEQRLLWQLQSRQAVFCAYLGQYDQAKALLEDSLAGFQGVADDEETAFALLNLATISLRQHEFTQDMYDQAKGLLNEALALVQAGAYRHLEADCQFRLGNVSLQKDLHKEAQQYYERALFIYRLLEDRRGASSALNNLGVVADFFGEYGRALSYYQQGFTTCQLLGDLRRQSIGLVNVGFVYYRLGAFTESAPLYQQSLQLSQEIGDRNLQASSLHRLGLLKLVRGKPEAAYTYGRQVLQLAQALQNGHKQGLALALMGQSLLQMGVLAEAEVVLTEAYTIRQGLGRPEPLLGSAADLAALALAQAELATAQRQIEPVLAYLQSSTPSSSTLWPLSIDLICYEILLALADERALPVLMAANQRLEAEAALITDSDLRQSFMENVPWHRQLRTLYQTALATT